MKSHWFILIAIVSGLVCGLCLAILLLPERAAVQEESVQIAAKILSNADLSHMPAENKAEYLNLPGTVTSSTLDTAFASIDSWTVKPGTRILLLPHHLVAARQIASLVSATPQPTVVYLVTPDHFGACKSVCVLDNPLHPPYQGGLKSPLIRGDIEGFAREHAITGLLPFLRRAWGNEISIVPIIVRPDATESQTRELTTALTSALQKDNQALLVATIDASHYLSAEVADFHDVLTQDVISSLADMEVGRAEIDAPAVLRVALKTARDLGLGDVAIQAHTNSLRLMQSQLSQESTSHFLVSFAPGDIAPQQEVALLFVGDMMFDRHVADRSRAAGSLDYPWQNIRGKEDRFFRGQDVVIGNLEGPVTDKRLAPNKGNVDFMFDLKIPNMLKRVGFDAVSQANNHALDQGRAAADQSRKNINLTNVAVFGDQTLDDEKHALTVIERRGRKIALLGFNVTDHELDKTGVARVIEIARQQADYTVVFMHWGNEYQARPNNDQVALAHWLVDRGVDAVIGSHPHWMQSVEVYRNRPIAYSLGNFIFDQDFSSETKLGLVVGLVLSKPKSAMYLYPVEIDQSQPKLLTGKERQTQLDRLASFSDPSLSSAIKNGVVTINQ